MNEWIRCSERLPEATVGAVGEEPIISDDVLVLFETGPDVANYDYDAGWWSMVNHGFSQPDCDPLYWMPIPEYPEGYKQSV